MRAISPGVLIITTMLVVHVGSFPVAMERDVPKINLKAVQEEIHQINAKKSEDMVARFDGSPDVFAEGDTSKATDVSVPRGMSSKMEEDLVGA